MADPSINPVALDAAARLIREGGVVAFPTETVYGLGADAFNVSAVARIFEIKKRPSFDPLIVHIAEIEEARDRLVKDWPNEATRLAESFWPGPLTLVLPRRADVPDIVTAGLSTVAVRMPNHPLALELLRASATPIAAPSANRFGSVSPTTAPHVRDSLGDEVDGVLDGGPCAAGVESTILAWDADGAPVLLRPGATPIEAIENAIGRVRRAADRERIPNHPEAPGMLAKHYATRTPIRLVSHPADAESVDAARREIEARDSRFGLLLPGNERDVAKDLIEAAEAVEVLSETGDRREAAANLFAAMRRLDALRLDLLVAFEVAEEGLGLAINDRLRRAARH